MRRNDRSALSMPARSGAVCRRDQQRRPIPFNAQLGLHLENPEHSHAKETIMRNLAAAVFATLDGVVQDPGGFGELDRGGWAPKYFDDASIEASTNALLKSDTFLLGRRTYEVIEKAWSNNTGPYAEAMTKIPKVVISRTLDGPLPWNATALPGEAAETVAKLKQQRGGDILMYGSFNLMRTLLEHHLIDQLHVGAHPVIIGPGKRLFDGVRPDALRFVAATPTSTGAVHLNYAP
jgi:dihydrofolate reductase